LQGIINFLSQPDIVFWSTSFEGDLHEPRNRGYRNWLVLTHVKVQYLHVTVFKT